MIDMFKDYGDEHGGGAILRRFIDDGNGGVLGYGFSKFGSKL